MPKIEASTIEKYQQILARDPQSQVFAPLAEAYREMGMLQEAEKVARSGVQRHPNFVGGLVTLAKIFKDQQKYHEGLSLAKRSAELAPQNLLAHQISGELHLALRQPKEALRAFKMVLFLNPNSSSAKKAVNKLESLTADEYDDEVFAMTKLTDIKSETVIASMPQMARESLPAAPAPEKNKALERMLSLIDAFIVRNEIEKAHLLLRDTQSEFGDHTEIDRRLKSLQIKPHHESEVENLSPMASREQLVLQRKLETLEMLLRNIESYRARG